MSLSHTIKRFLLGSLAALVVLATAAFAWVWFAPCALGGCAPMDDLAAYQAEGSDLLDIHGNSFGTLATVNRRIISLDSLPPHVPRAFLAVEDQRFYDHGGIDIRRVAGALLSNIQAGGVAEGGSTITMQLARNLFPEWLPYQERSIKRKVMEARVARQLERSLSKDKILELYLNHIYLGEGAYGVEAAALEYFGKPASQLTLAEAALLGGLPKAPSQINPVVNRKAARERRDLVLEQMGKAGYVSQTEAEQAREQPIRLATSDEDESGPRGSYFVEQVRQEMEERVGSRFYTAGLKIHTTLDPRAQQAAEEELLQQLVAIESGRFGAYRHPTYAQSKGVAEETGNTPYLQGAVVLMDASSGEIRALVGGRDFQDSKFNRAVQAMRQPGSAFKPFVYAAALERYGSPAHVVEDAPIRMVLDGGRVWEPKNYTGNYDGPITLRDALTRSKNTVTVRVAQDVGMGSVIGVARDLGVTSDIPEVPSAALGATEVRPMELVRAYAALANGGQRVEPHLIRKVVDRHGRVLWEASPEQQPAIDRSVAFVLTSMLRDVVDRGTGSAARTGGYGGPAAGKTGTTNDATDVWFVGYTPELVGGVWMGLDDPKTIVRGASGGTLAAPVWGRIMGRVYQGRPTPAPWSVPPGVTQAEVEAGTGLAVSSSCRTGGPTYTEYFLHGSVPERDCRPAQTYVASASDTAWVDEEWGAGQDSIYTEPQSTGINWPELDELRRRTQASSGTLPPTTATDSGAVRDSAGGVRARTLPRAQPERTRAGQQPREPEPEEPRLLGTPVRRDSADSPPPAARDTSETRGSGADSTEVGSDRGNNPPRSVVQFDSSSGNAAQGAKAATTGPYPSQG